jgi:hypothetical protein
MLRRTGKRVLEVDADELQRIDQIAHDVRDLLEEHSQSVARGGTGTHRAPDRIASELTNDVNELVDATSEMWANATRPK